MLVCTEGTGPKPTYSLKIKDKYELNIELACVSILLVLYGALSFNVSIARMQFRDGKNTEEKVEHLVRTHGNASEYIPLFVAIFMYFSFSQASWLVHSVVVLATISRVFHAIGMLRIESISQRHPLRFFGALGTYLSIFMFGFLLAVEAF